MTTKAKKFAGLHLTNSSVQISPTFTMNYKKASEKFDLSAPPRRPNRCQPVEEETLEDELRCWSEASDESLENFEADLQKD